MAFIETAPFHRAALSRRGLLTARDFLGLSGVILSGHPRRHVLRVYIDGEPFILKKEHHVRWRDRFASAWAGFGWHSTSVREAIMLGRLRDAGVQCSEVISAGEHGGQAFLLLREERDMANLRNTLAHTISIPDRRALSQGLGRELARIHAAGFDQPDLYAKHILAEKTHDGYRFCFLDWQRSTRRKRVSWSRRYQDLAALDASLADHLASKRLRVDCLCAYLSAENGIRRGQTPPLADVARAVRQITNRLLERRKVRELRQPPLPEGAQQLLWLEEEERLCVARDFYEELAGQMPSWLPRDPQPSADGNCAEYRLILLGAGRTGHLVQRWRRVPIGWLRRGKFPAPEFAHAAAIFRLQRFGVSGPRLLAMGYRHLARSQRFSFLLTEPPVGDALRTVLRHNISDTERDALLQQFETLTRRVREAGYEFQPGVDVVQAWVVQGGRLTLASVEPLREARDASHGKPANRQWRAWEVA